jgi:hypothetical protein
VRWATPVVVAVVTILFASTLAGCSDLREFRGTWHGPRVGDAAVVRVGWSDVTSASLEIENIDAHGLTGALTIDGVVTSAPLVSLPGAEADVLAGMTFTGSPLRVYLAFVALSDGLGDALALVALYDQRRIELRVLRGGTSPLYAIFALTEDSP